MVLRKLCLRRLLRCCSGLFLWLAGIPLPRVFVFLLHRAAPGRGTLDSGTLHERSRAGDLQLLRANQPASAQHGLSQRAPRFAINPLEQIAEAAGDGSRILRQPKVSLLLKPTSVRVHLRQKVQPVFSNRENEAAQRRSAILSASAPPSDSGCPECGDNYLLMYDTALRLK